MGDLVSLHYTCRGEDGEVRLEACVHHRDLTASLHEYLPEQLAAGIDQAQLFGSSCKARPSSNNLQLGSVPLVALIMVHPCSVQPHMMFDHA